MSYNDVILEGTIIGEPKFYQYLDAERIEFKLLTLEGSYTNKEGVTKRIKCIHKILVYNKYYVESAKKDLIGNRGKVIVRGKLASMIDADGCYSYCVAVVGNHHYLKITGNYFRMAVVKQKLKDYLSEI